MYTVALMVDLTFAVFFGICLFMLFYGCGLLLLALMIHILQWIMRDYDYNSGVILQNTIGCATSGASGTEADDLEHPFSTLTD